MKRSYIFRTEPSVLFTEKVYSLAKADEFVQSGPSSPQNTTVHFFKLFIHTWSSRSINKNVIFLMFIKCYKSYLWLTIFQREVINIAPHKPPEYSYVSHKPQRHPRNEDIYNHLNEKEEHEDSDNYDHACAATFDIGDSSLYNKVRRKMHIPIFPEEMNADINGYSTVKL